MTSNGIALERKLDSLVSAGLNRLNISLDTLKAHKFELISRRNGFDKVWRCIEKAEGLFDPVKVDPNLWIRKIKSKCMNQHFKFTKVMSCKSISVR